MVIIFCTSTGPLDQTEIGRASPPRDSNLAVLSETDTARFHAELELLWREFKQLNVMPIGFRAKGTRKIQDDSDFIVWLQNVKGWNAPSEWVETHTFTD